jgi:hypothetical protein
VSQTRGRSSPLSINAALDHPSPLSSPSPPFLSAVSGSAPQLAPLASLLRR